jgi:hypothetical protein
VDLRKFNAEMNIRLWLLLASSIHRSSPVLGAESEESSKRDQVYPIEDHMELRLNGMKRWREQRRLLDQIIQTRGLDWDQGRDREDLRNCGPGLQGTSGD